MDRGRVVAEGTGGDLKAAIGAGQVRLRVRHPGQRPTAARILADGLDVEVHPDTDPRALSAVVPADAVNPSVHAKALREMLEPDQQRLLAPAGVTVDAVVPGAFARLWRVPVAGAYGAAPVSRRILVVQALPAVVALVLVLASS